MKKKYDVIVVGAGPGGSITAKTCAEKGLDVLLIEKRQEIGVNVRCAEGVGRESLKKYVKIDDKWISANIKGSILVSPDGTQIKMSEVEVDDSNYDSNYDSNSKAGLTLERKLFDRYLAQQAAMAGADLMVKTKAIDLLRSNGKIIGAKISYMGTIYDIFSDIIIGADGIESKVGRWGGINTALKPNDIEVCAQFLVSNINPGEYSKFYLGTNYLGGYLWSFPKGHNSANVGIGISGGKSGKVNAISLLQRFVDANMPKAKISEIVVGGVPVSGPIKQTVANGLILVGDAARQSDPLTGGGIINAMNAGKLAGDICIKAKELGDYSINVLKEYETKWRSTIGKELTKSLHVKNFLIKLTDEQLNHLAHSLDGIDVSKLALPSFLMLLFKKNPRLLWELRNLF